jgi:hypothetical protein
MPITWMEWEDFDDILLDLAAFRIEEDDLLAHESHIAGALKNAGLVELFVHGLQEGDLVSQRHLKRIDAVGAVEAAWMASFSASRMGKVTRSAATRAFSKALSK